MGGKGEEGGRRGDGGDGVGEKGGGKREESGRRGRCGRGGEECERDFVENWENNKILSKVRCELNLLTQRCLFPLLAGGLPYISRSGVGRVRGVLGE